MRGAGYQIRTLSRLADAPAADWDALFDGPYPFTRHAFLAALEAHGCVGGHTGWTPRHLVVVDEAGKLAGAMPLYEKRHSWGEFVFDFAWAQASQRIGVPYYPKLVAAIPFTPVTGPRLAARDEAARGLLLAQLAGAVGGSGARSAHALFLTPDEPWGTEGWLERRDVQFHWFNRGYAGFEGFLASMTHDKRKKILRERRRIAESGLRFEVRAGHELDEAGWATVYAMYRNTYDERGMAPYLSLDFFLDYGRRPDTPLRLVLAYDGHTPVAVAIMLAAGGVLYGRHWGCIERHHSLHFETCYYQGIELCLREGYMRFDAGTQGEHKRARGFEPVVTRSVHRLADARLHAAVGEFLGREREAIHHYRDDLASHGPFRHGSAPPG